MILLSLTLICPKVQWVGFHQMPTKHDYTIFYVAKKRCPVLFPASPCLKKFYKRGEQSYWALCGAKEEV